jgi:hypothetical protein
VTRSLATLETFLIEQPRILWLLDPFGSLRNLLIMVMRFDGVVHESSHRFGLQEAHIDLLRHVEVFVETARPSIREIDVASVDRTLCG